MLEYTGGMDLNALARKYAAIVDAFLKWNDAYQFYVMELAQEFPEHGEYSYCAAPDFSILGDYEDTLQLTSIGVLVRDHKSVVKIASIMRSHRGEDGLFEELIDIYSADSHRTRECVLDTPFDIVAKTFVTENDNDVIQLITAYLLAWYPAMKDHPRWHDGHLSVNEQGQCRYYGYWSFEAAAAAYMLDVDAKGITNIYFPHDLLDYANRLHESKIYTSFDPKEVKDGKIEGGGTCPQSGFWETSGQIGSRRYLEQGELMAIIPNFQNGQTIWQWSEDQVA